MNSQEISIKSHIKQIIDTCIVITNINGDLIRVEFSHIEYYGHNESVFK